MAPSPRDASPQLKQAMDDSIDAVNRTIERLLPQTDLAEAPLYDAMRHGVLAGGKRLRPFLAVHSAFLFNVDPTRARRVAAAVEFIHCYSLIHDDLPAMDDAALRRGHPTVHKKYGEATAILAGDALLTLAAQILSEPETHENPRVRCGTHPLTRRRIRRPRHGRRPDAGSHRRAAGFRPRHHLAHAAYENWPAHGLRLPKSGSILGKASEPHRKALRNYAYDLGLAFQVTDDILDVEADPQDTGKDTKKDEVAGKSTFVRAMGKQQARERTRCWCNRPSAISGLRRPRRAPQRTRAARSQTSSLGMKHIIVSLGVL